MSIESEVKECETIAAKAIEKVESMMRTLLHFNSHDLRGPICRMSAALEILKVDPETPDLIEIIEHSINEMLSVTHAINDDLFSYTEELNCKSTKAQIPITKTTKSEVA